MVCTATLSAARLGGILDLADKSVSFRELASRLEDRQRLTVADATAGARAFGWSALVTQNARTVALVAPSEDRARRWRAELAGWLGEERVLAFPERESMPFEASAPSGTSVHQRLLTLWRLATTQAPVAVVTSLRALLEHTIPPEELARRGRTLRAGDRLSWADTAAWLFDLGYEPMTEVSEPGTFSRRGGIIDIYPASAEHPARVELFGDEIETLRAFDPVTQRSQSALEELIVLPAREFALESAPALAEKLARAGWDRLAREDDDEGADLSPYARLVDALREGGYAPGVDAFAPSLGATASLLDHLGARATVVFEDTVELDLAHDALEAQAEERRDELAQQGLPVAVFPPPYVPRSKIDSLATEHGSARMGSGPDAIRLGWGGTTSYAGRLADFIGTLATARRDGITLIATPQAARLAELLADRDVTAVARETVENVPAPGALVVARVPLAEGFAIPELGLRVFTDAEVFGFRKPRHPEQRRRRVQIGSFLSDLKPDMERGRPMDRLIVGDVGYGKTEVALRAAFKAVQDGKQVAIVVPTTVLAQQHYETFGERLATFPVNVEMLSRFRSPAEQRAVAEGIGTGDVDIVVGTHRVLQKDVQFRDLGLVVIDEEHRFGVKHKERLKQMRTEVDVLSMTATPIPRTLHMALSGVRDISVIETPPENRQPIETHVVERSDDVLREAIVREIDRGGQVYYVHNRVQGIEQEAHRLRELVPSARYVVAHGQMDDRKLERVMVEFADAEHDVLVCTTIIESGLDIPNVNTIVINRAGTLGLAQLYQLRGRVGRSAEKAYAYLLYTKEQHLTEQARKRLQAVFEASELGAGFKIAMHDLEIRGAGNILGAEQHGHVAAIGFELYTQLLEEAVNEQRGAPRAAALPEITVDLALSTAIPDDYVPSRQRKLELYRRIAGLALLDDLAGLREELRDRYGPPPEPVRNLLYGVEIKLRAAKAGATEVRARGPELRVVMGRDIQPDERTRVLRSFPKAQAGQRQIRLSVLDVKADWRDALTGLLDRLAA